MSAALVLLAAGSGSRFGAEDKLLADLAGKPVLAHTARRFAPLAAARLAVIAPGQAGREAILRAHGWRVIENAAASSGQASSLRAAVADLSPDASITHVLFALADMPLVPAAHVRAMLAASGAGAAMTRSGAVLTPPALFPRGCFPELMQLSGDRGARALFDKQADKIQLPLDPDLALDIDSPADLARAADILRGARD